MKGDVHAIAVDVHAMEPAAIVAAVNALIPEVQAMTTVLVAIATNLQIIANELTSEVPIAGMADLVAASQAQLEQLKTISAARLRGGKP
jgi:hypothetical protein